MKKHMTIKRLNAALLALAFGTGNALATDGVWKDTSGNWSAAGNWTGGVADGVGATANFQGTMASGNKTATLDDANRTLGILNLGFSSSSRGLTINTSGGYKLILDNGGSDAQINFKNGGGNVGIQVAVELKSNLLITNSDSGGNKGFFFTAGGISSANGALTITNTSNANSRTKFNIGISDGTAGNTITFNQTSGWSEFTAANTYTGSTTNGGGLLHIGISTAFQNSALNTTGSITADANNGLKLYTGVSSLTFGGLTGSKNLASLFNTAISATNIGYVSVTGLTLNPGTGKSYTYDAAIANGAADMTLTKTGIGTQILTGTSSYTGSTVVSAGVLAVNGSGSINSSSGVTLSGGTFRYNSSVAYSKPLTFTSGTVAGTNLTGTLDNLIIGGNQTISPGNSPGTASTGSQTWAGGGSYVWEINKATGTAGADPGWDLENGTGTLNITAANVSPFNILVTSLTLANAAGLAANFNDATGYNWLIADFNAVTGFDAHAFNINTAAFTNPFTGTFDVALGGGAMPGDISQIYLTYTPIPEPGAALLGGLGLLALFRRRR